MEYLITATLRSPTNSSVGLDLQTLSKDITSAVEIYNSNYPHRHISEIQYNKTNVQFKYKTTTQDKKVGYELKLFSKILYNDFNWNELTKEPNKLFNYKYELYMLPSNNQNKEEKQELINDIENTIGVVTFDYSKKIINISIPKEYKINNGFIVKYT